MPLTRADVQTIRDAESAHRAAVAAVAERAADPSVTVVKNADGTSTALVRAGGKFREFADVTFIDMTGGKP